MSEKYKSPEEISQYMGERLKRENKGEFDIQSKELSSSQIEQGALELMDLTLEKQDLIESLSIDAKTIKGKTKSEKTEKIIAGETDLDQVDFRKLSRRFSSGSVLEKTMEKTKDEIESIKYRIAELSSNQEILESYQKNLQSKIEIIKLARQVEGARMYLDKLDLSESMLLASRNNEDVKLTKADKAVLKENEAEKKIIKEKIKEWIGAPEVYYEVNRREALDYRKQLLKGGIVETPSVKKEINQILGHLELGIPVFLRGHLGAGKTEVLLHVSRKYYGVEPEFISGSEEATKYDIYGKTQIGVKAEDQKINEYKLGINEYQAMFPDASADEVKKVEKEYYDNIVVKGQTTSFFQYGPLVRAMKEGKPVIIDEIDGIPHSILMRLNHILTRKPGDKVKIQENAGEEFEIQPGFCVMATGNIKSSKYKREELDAAFLSRWWSSEIKYLPVEETQKILIASLIDKRGNLEMNSSGDLDGLKRFAKAAGEIQKIFTGEKTDMFGEGGDAARGVSAGLEKSVLSMRDIWNVVRPWKARNFDKPLDNYIHAEFIKKATVQKDQIYLTQLFCRFGFFQDWDIEQFAIAGLDKKKLEGFRKKEN